MNEGIKTLYPGIQSQAKAMLDELAGINAYGFCFYRSPIGQAAEWAKGRLIPGTKKTTDSKPFWSFHQYGLAIDVAFGGPGKWSWKRTNNWQKLVSIVKKHGFESGSSWGDWPHTQITFGLSINDLYKIYKKTWKLVNVWAELDKLMEAKNYG